MSNVLGDLSFKLTFNVLMPLNPSHFEILADPGPSKPEYVGVSVIPKISRWFQCDTDTYSEYYCTALCPGILVLFWMGMRDLLHVILSFSTLLLTSFFFIFLPWPVMYQNVGTTFLQKEGLGILRLYNLSTFLKVYPLILLRSEIIYRLLDLVRTSSLVKTAVQQTRNWSQDWSRN